MTPPTAERNCPHLLPALSVDSPVPLGDRHLDRPARPKRRIDRCSVRHGDARRVPSSTTAGKHLRHRLTRGGPAYAEPALDDALPVGLTQRSEARGRPLEARAVPLPVANA